MPSHGNEIIFTEEALKAQDGKIIGEATLRWNPETKALEADYKIDDPKLAKQLMDMPIHPFSG